MRPPSILFFAEAGPEQPCSLFRCFMPARALQMYGWRASVAIEGVIWPDGRFTSQALPEPPDVAVIRRPIDDEDGVTTGDISEQVAAARQAGQRVYVDIDDDMWNLPPTNPAYEIMHSESLAAFDRVIAASDGAIVTTPGLATSLATHQTVPIHVCPNGIDPALFPLREGEHDPLRIGWLGPVKWRYDDLASIAEWFVPFLNTRRETVEFWHLGNMPGDPYQAEDVLPGLEIPIHKVPWVPYQCLPQSLAQIDVIVIPQRLGKVYEKFADSRSPTSAMASIASGAVVWATPIDSYRRLFGAALPADLATIVDSKAQRRQYRRAQRKLLDKVNLAASALAYARVFT